jgi:hypothetical protein
MNPTERRRIVWGNQEHANLDPFVVDMFGRVFNDQTGQAVTPLTLGKAAKAWRRSGDPGRMHTFDPEAPNLAGEKLPAPKPTELVREWSDALLVDPVTAEAEPVRESVTRWLFDMQGLTGVAYREPPEWLPVAGNPHGDWFSVKIEDRFVSVLHGPSVAAWLAALDRQ